MKRYLTLLLAWGLLVSGVFTASAQTYPAGMVGSYEGQMFFLGSNPAKPYGRLEFTVSANGKTTGKLTAPNKKAYPFSVTLKLNGSSTQATATGLDAIVLARTFGVARFFINLTVNADGTFAAGGMSNLNEATGGGFYLDTGTAIKVRKFTGKAGNTPEWAGTYTLAFAPTESTAGHPSGAGFATATIDAKGVLTYKGKLGDGTVLSGKAQPSADASYIVYSTPYAKGGYFKAVIDLSEIGTTGKYRVVDSMGADVAWAKTAGDTKAYSAGFLVNSLLLFMEPWAKPAAGSLAVSTLGIEANERFGVTYTGGFNVTANAATLPTKVNVTVKNEIVANGGGNGAPYYEFTDQWKKLWSVKINPANGSFKGTLTIKPATKQVKIPVEGVLLLSPSGSGIPVGLGQYAVAASYTNGAGALTGEIEFAGPVETFQSRNSVTAGNYQFVIAEIPSGLQPPDAMPDNGTTVNFSISADLKVLTFNGVKYPLKGDGRPVSLGYQAGRIAITIHLNATTGAVMSIEGIFAQSALRVGYFNTKSPASTYLWKL